MAEDSQHNCCSISTEHRSGVGISIREGGSRHVFRKECDFTQLHAAVSAKNVERLKSLLLAGADLQLRDKKGYTALHVAILSWGHHLRNWPKPHPGILATPNDVLARAELCLRTLCDHGIKINATLGDSSGQAALHLAVCYKVLPAVPILASYGADLNAEDSVGMTPLHLASSTLQKDIVSSLIRLGADVNALAALIQIIRRTGNTPLHLATVAAAIQHNKAPETRLGCISELVEHGADTEVVNWADRTPLQEACACGEEEPVDALLTHGADINRRTEAGEGCLFLFLDRQRDVRRSLLSKLICLTSQPLALHDRHGRLPVVLTGPRYAVQRERLLALSRQPRSLKEMCRNHVYLSQARSRRELRDVLPEAIFDYVFNCWDSAVDVSFVFEDDGKCLGSALSTLESGLLSCPLEPVRSLSRAELSQASAGQAAALAATAF
ncbi:Ankyrin repeat domain-containing protein 61 [Merluccius polli]|uniref:Ankyrin repeat domain-containing protein 61 n=1 Tax=Merluccius polli TaxID=89951 RepID=A0AA47MVW2_MERPO|nr:Ankyrin repeat domain-containing protein 61 [Merluccius polli]